MIVCVTTTRGYNWYLSNEIVGKYLSCYKVSTITYTCFVTIMPILSYENTWSVLSHSRGRVVMSLYSQYFTRKLCSKNTNMNFLIYLPCARCIIIQIREP